jgi:hypothetical protein
MLIKSAFPSKWLKAEDLQNKEFTLNIDRVEMADVGTESSPEEKPVLFFVGRQKGCVLNKTNAEAVALHYGDNTESWEGKPVILYPTTTMFGGKSVPCIRMRVPSAPALPGDDIPF